MSLLRLRLTLSAKHKVVWPATMDSYGSTRSRLFANGFAKRPRFHVHFIAHGSRLKSRGTRVRGTGQEIDSTRGPSQRDRVGPPCGGSSFASLNYLLTAGRATAAECEEGLKINRRFSIAI
jgi:hypothetical protein